MGNALRDPEGVFCRRWIWAEVHLKMTRPPPDGRNDQVGWSRGR